MMSMVINYQTDDMNKFKKIAMALYNKVDFIKVDGKINMEIIKR